MAVELVSTAGELFAGGAGVGGGAIAVWKLLDWLGTRVDKREDAVAKTAATVAEANAALILNLQDQVTKVCVRLDTAEEELAQCRARDAKNQEEIGRLRGVVQGYGDAKQEAAKIVAAAFIEKDDRHGDIGNNR